MNRESKTRIYSGSTQACLRPLLLNLQPVRVPLVSSSNPSFFLDTWIMAPMGTSSSYAHLNFQAPIPSLITLGFWLQWAPRNFFKQYTLEAFSLRHNETLSSFQDLSSTTQALMNTKVHSKICKCNECTHKLSLRTNTQEKGWLRASLLFFK